MEKEVEKELNYDLHDFPEVGSVMEWPEVYDVHGILDVLDDAELMGELTESDEEEVPTSEMGSNDPETSDSK